MWCKFFAKLFSFVVLLLASQMQATSIITTAPSGTPTDGYKGSSSVMANGDVIRGHVMFKNGFEIPANGSVFYDADGPVFGNIVFNADSTLQLGSDLRLGGTGTCWSSSSSKIDAKGNTIVLGGDVTINNHTSIIETDLTIDGAGHSLTMTGLSQFKIDTNVTLRLKNMNFIIDPDFTSNSLFLCLVAPNNFNVHFENVCVYLGTDTLLFGDGDRGWTKIRGDVRIFGPYVVSATASTVDDACNCNIFIDQNSTLYIGPGTTLKLDGLDVASEKKIGMSDATSRLIFDGCTLTWKASSTNGNKALQLQRGTVFFQDKVVVKNFAEDGSTTNTDLSNGLIFGDGSSSNHDVNVRVLGGAYVVLQGCMQYKHS